MRIAVVKSCTLGDFILCLPALNLLRQSHPNALIEFYTYTQFAQRQKKNNKRYSAEKPPWIFLVKNLDLKVRTEVFPSFFAYLKLMIVNFFRAPELIFS